MNAWLVIALAGLASYALRISMTISDRLRLPPRIEASADMVAPAAFAALASSSLATSVVSAGTIAAAAPVVLAVAAAIVGTALSGRPYVAMLAGMPTYWLSSAALSP